MGTIGIQILSTLVSRATAILDDASLLDELEHLYDVFRANRYSKCQKHRAFRRPGDAQPRVQMADYEIGVTILPFFK